MFAKAMGLREFDMSAFIFMRKQLECFRGFRVLQKELGNTVGDLSGEDESFRLHGNWRANVTSAEDRLLQKDVNFKVNNGSRDIEK